MSVRFRRLHAEHERLVRLFADHERIRVVEAIGNPPDRYVIEYRVRGLVEEKGEIKEQALHRAQITLGPNYPRERPRCVMLTPVFHPNIDHLAICTEDIGSAGQTLDQTVVFIGEMIAYQAFNLQSPRNGDAARWTSQHLDELPLEGADLVPDLLTQGLPDLELSFTTTALLQAASLSEPSAAPVEASAEATPLTQPKAEPKLCANCGSSSASSELRHCVNGHFICKDCSLACQNCQQPLCVLCDTQQCSECKELFCSDCLILCEGCQSLTCLSHIQQCQLCQRWYCLVSCARSCQSCGLTCCQQHLDSANRCALCVSGSSGVTVTGKVLAPESTGPQ